MIRYQAAAIPYRQVGKPEVEVLLVTSRRRGRWVLPKGGVKRGTSPHLSALHEAFEEAGVLGIIEHLLVGRYAQSRLSRDGTWIDLRVDAFPMWVNTQLLSWPEMTARRRRWLPLSEAIDLLEDSRIREVLTTFRFQVFSGLISPA